MRLAALCRAGCDRACTACGAPRGPNGELRVVVGLQALTRAVAEIETAARRRAHARACRRAFDEVTQVMNRPSTPNDGPPRIRGSIWRRRRSQRNGLPLIARSKDAPTRLGELIALKDGEHWMLAVGGDAAAAGR